MEDIWKAKLRAFCEGLEMQNIDKMMTGTVGDFERIGIVMTEWIQEKIKGGVDGMGNMAIKLAKECMDVLRHECTCHEAYTGRGMIDPYCEWHEIGQYLLPIAKEILSQVGA